MTDRAHVAMAIFEGYLLSIEDFKVAIKEGLLGCKPMPETDTAIAHAYINYVGTYYESPTHRAYICGQHPTRQISGTTQNGEICGWGMHLDELDAQHLTEANWEFIRKKFTEEQIEAHVKVEHIKEQVASSMPKS